MDVYALPEASDGERSKKEKSTKQLATILRETLALPEKSERLVASPADGYISLDGKPLALLIITDMQKQCRIQWDIPHADKVKIPRAFVIKQHNDAFRTRPNIMDVDWSYG